MLKLITSFFLFFILNVSLAQLIATQTVPSNVIAGASFILKITIDRGEIDGFMKFSQTLPTGFTAEDIDDKGGDFTFAKNEVKIIWLNPPKEEVYTISYEITVSEEAQGTKNLSGKIIYITKKNERKIFGVPAKKIIIDKPVLKKSEVDGVSELNTTKAPPTLNMVSLVEEKNNLKRKEKIARENYGTKKAPIYVTVVKKTYKVQLGAFKVNSKMKGALKLRDIGKRYSGNFSTYEEAEAHKKNKIKEGYKDAFVVMFKTKVQVLRNDEFVLLENSNSDLDKPQNWSDCVTK
jgi:hypothetical protein